jgi:hypothetical protein
MGCHLPDNPNLPTPEMFVEFAHIYADEIWGDEQHESLSVMKGYLDRESNPDSLVVAAILIDDLHVKENTLDVNEFIRCILRRGLAPDHVVFEGRLGPVADFIISELPSSRLVWETIRKANKKVLSFITDSGSKIGLKNVFDNGDEEHTCAILSAAWSLCRAGICKFPQDSIVRLTEAPVTGERVVSVLHSKYQGVEAKVIELIRSIGQEDLVPRLELVFFS